LATPNPHHSPGPVSPGLAGPLLNSARADGCLNQRHNVVSIAPIPSPQIVVKTYAVRAMLKEYCLFMVQTFTPAARDWSVLDQSMGQPGFGAVTMRIGICRV
jgi:hypothetical protein